MILPLAACGGPLSTLDPVGPIAAATARLWWVMLAGGAVLFVLVMALLALAFLRPGWGERVRPGVWLLGLGFVMPMVVLTALLIVAFVGGERILAHPDEPGLVRVEAHASRWQWEFSYPDQPGAPVTRDLLHLPADRPVDVVVTSADVVHAFWVPRLAGKIDAVPGHANVIRLRTGPPGTYLGRSAEFSGPGYAGMMFTVEVEPYDAYRARLARP